MNAPSSSPLTVPVRAVSAGSGKAVVVVGVCLMGRGPFTFEVDTGAAISVVDKGLAASLGLGNGSPTLTSNGFGCTMNYSFARVTDWSVGRLALSSQELEIGALHSPVAPNLMGLLGADLLSRFGAIRLDYHHQSLEFAHSEGRPSTVSNQGRGSTPTVVAPLGEGTTTAIALNVKVEPFPSYAVTEVRAFLPVTLRSHRYQMLLDTGASGVSLTPEVVSSNNLMPLDEVRRSFAGFACAITESYYNVSDWSLGPLALPPAQAASTDLFGSLNGLIGSGIWQQYSPIVIDFTDAELLVGPRTTNP